MSLRPFVQWVTVVLLMLSSLACGTSDTPAPSNAREPEPTAPVEPEAEPAAEPAEAMGEETAAPEPPPEPPFIGTPASADARRALRELAQELTPRPHRPTPGMREYLQPCFATPEQTAAVERTEAAYAAHATTDPDDDALASEFYETCQLSSVIARDAGGNWVAVDVDVEESGSPAEIIAIVGHPLREREVFRDDDVGPGDASRLLALARRGRWGTTENRITAASLTEFGLGSYAPLVEIGRVEDDTALEGTRTFIHTVNDLDNPAYVLVAQRRGEEAVELARREGIFGACDGGGFYCEATEDECDATGLRAEGRLCVKPLGISRIAVHGDRIAVQGIVIDAGHGGYPPFHWFARLPAPGGVDEP